jgi:hypothetical protein
MPPCDYLIYLVLRYLALVVASTESTGVDRSR